jgi:hypothetical protein
MEIDESEEQFAKAYRSKHDSLHSHSNAIAERESHREKQNSRIAIFQHRMRLGRNANRGKEGTTLKCLNPNIPRYSSLESD